jgi:TPR repeat protein
MSLKGHGVQLDCSEAVKWFKKAAEQGDPNAQGILGIMYKKGAGAPRNDEQAYFWLTLAGNVGDKDVSAARDEVASHLTPEQIADVKKRIGEWKPTRTKPPAPAKASDKQ